MMKVIENKEWKEYMSIVPLVNPLLLINYQILLFIKSYSVKWVLDYKELVRMKSTILDSLCLQVAPLCGSVEIELFRVRELIVYLFKFPL